MKYKLNVGISLSVFVMVFYLLQFGCVDGPVAVSTPGTTYPDSTILLDKTNFDSLTNASGLVALVEFYSPFCLACNLMDSIMHAISVSYSGTALVGKVNILEDDSLKHAFFIADVPTFVFLKGGTEVLRMVGRQQEDVISGKIDSLLLVSF